MWLRSWDPPGLRPVVAHGPLCPAVARGCWGHREAPLPRGHGPPPRLRGHRPSQEHRGVRLPLVPSPPRSGEGTGKVPLWLSSKPLTQNALLFLLRKPFQSFKKTFIYFFSLPLIIAQAVRGVGQWDRTLAFYEALPGDVPGSPVWGCSLVWGCP